ncbi:DUF4254 domain-containing protein [Nocardia sp. CA-290969]|uniref:DUF4254 domain-containing protein n=1 Tax=Nocardia sp. CA-290969 TaxID=3239986 RepID=UPI003D8CB0DA
MPSSPPILRATRLTDPLDSLFPTGEALLSAIRGQHVGRHPLASVAHQFGQLHQQHLRGPTSTKYTSRAQLSLQADRWVVEHVPLAHPEATLHFESLGTVIDRIAVQQVRAFHLLMNTEPSAPIVHTAWYRLAELVDDYTDLTTAVTRRSRRLPLHGPPLIASSGFTRPRPEGAPTISILGPVRVSR